MSILYSRRATPRAEVDNSVYAFWYCDGRGDLSPVRNINLGGLFIETRGATNLGASVELHFLVNEGQIRAKGVVRHAEPGLGVGLKFTALNEQDRLHFGALMKRLYAMRCTARPAEAKREVAITSKNLILSH